MTNRASFKSQIMAVRSATHSINQTRVAVCLPVGVGERSEPAVSVAASCSHPHHPPSVSLQPRLISALQLSLILLLHCRPHEEFSGQTLPLHSLVCYLCARAATLCALVNSVPPFFLLLMGVTRRKLFDLGGLWVNKYRLDSSVCVCVSPG